MKTFNVYEIDNNLYINQLKPRNYLEEIITNFSPIIDNEKFKKIDIDELLNKKIIIKSTTN